MSLVICALAATLYSGTIYRLFCSLNHPYKSTSDQNQIEDAPSMGNYLGGGLRSYGPALGNNQKRCEE